MGFPQVVSMCSRNCPKKSTRVSQLLISPRKASKDFKMTGPHFFEIKSSGKFDNVSHSATPEVAH